MEGLRKIHIWKKDVVNCENDNKGYIALHYKGRTESIF